MDELQPEIGVVLSLSPSQAERCPRCCAAQPIPFQRSGPNRSPRASLHTSIPGEAAVPLDVGDFVDFHLERADGACSASHPGSAGYVQIVVGGTTGFGEHSCCSRARLRQFSSHRPVSTSPAPGCLLRVTHERGYTAAGTEWHPQALASPNTRPSTTAGCPGQRIGLRATLGGTARPVTGSLRLPRNARNFKRTISMGWTRFVHASPSRTYGQAGARGRPACGHSQAARHSWRRTEIQGLPGSRLRPQPVTPRVYPRWGIPGSLRPPILSGPEQLVHKSSTRSPQGTPPPRPPPGRQAARWSMSE